MSFLTVTMVNKWETFRKAVLSKQILKLTRVDANRIEAHKPFYWVDVFKLLVFQTILC